MLEPFFTTKPTGPGTGLGLSRVYGNMEQHEGGLQISSVPNEGTTVSLYLPVSDAELVTNETIAVAIPQADYEETLLAIDDDAGVLASTAELLEKPFSLPALANAVASALNRHA